MSWWLPFALCALPGVTFDDALARVSGVSDVAARAAEAKTRSEGVSKVSGFTSNPQLTAQPGYRVDGDAAGVEGQLTLQQYVNLGGLAEARREAVRAEAAEAKARWNVALLERRIAVGRAWLDTWTATRAHAVAEEEVQQAADALARIERAASQGMLTRVDVAEAKARLAETRGVALDWEGRRVESGAALAMLLGLEEAPPLEGPPPQLEEPSLAALTPEALPAVQLLSRQLDSEQRRADEVKAQWATQLQLQVQGGHDAPAQWFGNVGVGVVLPLLEQGWRDRVAHAANSQRMEGERAQELRRATVMLAMLRHELEHSRETLTLLEQERLPAALEVVELEERRFASGDVTQLELGVVRRQALEAKLATELARGRLLAARHEARELGRLP